MRLGDLKDILYSQTGNIQMAILYDLCANDDIAEGSIEHIVTFYPFVDVKRITAFHDKLIITI
jgi:hypothetical protein